MLPGIAPEQIESLKLIGIFMAAVITIIVVSLIVVNRADGDKKSNGSRRIKGKALECPVCKNTKFWERKTMMNTRWRTFFEYDYTNREATNYICENCGYISWFISKPIIEISK